MQLSTLNPLLSKVLKVSITILLITSFFYANFFYVNLYAQDKEKPKNDITFDENHNVVDEDEKQKGLKSAEQEALFTEGVKLYILGEYQKALDIFDKCKADNKDNAAVHFKIAECLVRLGKYEKAVSPAERAITLSPKNQYYYWLLAEIYKAKDDYKAAIKVYEDLLKTVKVEENFYFEMANCYLLQEKYEKAIEKYDEAEKIFGINEATVAQKQKIYLSINDVKKALIEGEKLIKAFPNEQDYWLAQAELLIEHQKYEEAEKILADFLREFPEDGHVFLLLSEVAMGRNDKPKQKEYLLKAFNNSSLTVDRKLNVLATYYRNLQTQEVRQMGLQLAEIVAKNYPENGKANQIYGDYLVANNQKKEARNAYIQSLKYGKDNYNIWERVIIFDFDLQEFDAMLKHSEQAVELFPNQAMMWFYHGSAKMIKKDHEEAIAAFEQAKMLTRNNIDMEIEIHARLGDAYNATKQYAKSDKSYNKVLELNPNHIETLNNYSYYLALRKDKLDIAKQMANKMLKLLGTNIQSNYIDTYGWVLYMAGDYENAKTQLQKAAENSTNATILEHYGDVLFKVGQIDAAVTQWEKAKQNNAENPEILDKKIKGRKIIE
jgi:tetratricopeptide (TPR) repeat protein